MTTAGRENHVPRYFHLQSHEIRVVTVTHREGEQCQVSAKPRNDKQGARGACGHMGISCVILDLIIDANSLWLAASLLTLGLVELNSRGHWSFFTITAEMSTNKEARVNHWHPNYHHYAQYPPETHLLNSTVTASMSPPQAGPGAS